MRRQIASDNYVQLANDVIGADQLSNREAYQAFDGSTHVTASAVLTRQSSDTTWLSDLIFPTGLGLAPGPGAYNQINFGQYSETETGLYSGFSGQTSLSFFAVRASTVPEPGTLVLFALGLAGVGLFRHRRGPRYRAVVRDRASRP